ncbi:EAL domain-containing protein [Thiocapsa roseopersicina]|uniref:PAS domain S-box-containing protein/diguanylate cyclase (GGDEF) domain-containing protein n=1 Tax=Thiocapsa roseopersicina TaxID=1058 RepID=A0A1H2U7P2_THIRO|nr:EAL domain-containing protein [Thiocapsa roseopersicina]SDW52166.1 PAS domain S-box-containing protein/diguanylate cyclase (GGDEF) domain-containing protein [Thiocapsa roseopersicina]
MRSLLARVPIGLRFGLVILMTQAALIAWVVHDNQRLSNAALTQLHETRLTVLTALLSESLTPLLVQRDIAALQESLDRFGDLPEVRYLEVDDARGRRLAEFTHPHPSRFPIGGDLDPHPVPQDAAQWETAIPLQLIGQTYGTLHVGISTDIFAETRQGLIEQSLRNGMIGLGGLLLVIVPLAFWASRRLGHLDAAARAIAEGNLGRRLDETGDDEIGRLAVSFNRMADALGQRESALRDAKADLERIATSKYRILFEATTDAVMLFDRDHGLFDCNPAALRLLGCDREALLGSRPSDLSTTPLPVGAHVLAPAAQAGPTGENSGFDWCLRRRDTCDPVEVEVLLTSVQLDGSTLLQMVARDIGARKGAEAAIKRSEEKYRFLLEYSYDIIYLFATDGSFIFVSPSWSRLMGYSVEETLATHFSVYVHPEDLHICNEAFSAVVETGEMRRNIEYRVRHGDGTWRWHSSSAMPFRDENGTIVGFQGIARDVTEQRETQEQLRIAAIAFEAQEGMVVTDASGVILRVNGTFTRITGYSAEEAVGQTPRLLKSARHDAAFYKAMWSSILETGSWEGEVWNRRKCGEIYPQWLTVTAVPGPDGRITHYVGTLSDITQRKAAEEEIRELAFFDPLTRLPNRRLLLDRLNLALASSRRHGDCGALFYIDLDDFKTLNDTLGHDQGDRLLQQVALRLTERIRESDTLARLGGDEFVVMIEHLSPNPLEAAQQAETLGNGLLGVLRLPYDLDGQTHYSAASIGITLFDPQPMRVEELMKQGDMAMYRAKAAGRNTMRFFDPSMQSEISARATLEAQLRCGLRDERFMLYYQVQVDRDGGIIGAECLLRWQDQQGCLISPAVFIPLAEQSGLILPIGHWVLQTACTQLAAWSVRTETAQLTLAVNISARQFRRTDFVDQVLACIEGTGANPSRLKLEITESLLLDDVEDTVGKMIALKARGVGFALDDFGTGYSSLSYLKRLPFDQLKIDRSFVLDVLTDANAAAIARTIIALGRTLELAVIAEGVETEAQRDWLAAHGCHAYQGYFFGRPEPLERLSLDTPNIAS